MHPSRFPGPLPFLSAAARSSASPPGNAERLSPRLAPARIAFLAGAVATVTFLAAADFAATFFVPGHRNAGELSRIKRCLVTLPVKQLPQARAWPSSPVRSQYRKSSLGRTIRLPQSLLALSSDNRWDSQRGKREAG